VADTVTALLGIAKVQGLLEEPPEHEPPLTLQLENCQLAEGVAVTEINEPTPSEQPLGQLGETEPEPERTLVVKDFVGSFVRVIPLTE
jgi:hypothetical protein